MLLSKLKLFVHKWWVWQVYFSLFHKPSSDGAQAICYRSEYLPRSLYNIWKKCFNEFWNSLNIPFLHSRVKLFLVSMQKIIHSVLKRKKMYQTKMLKIIKMHLLMEMSQIINTSLQTLLHNFVFGILKLFV